MGGSSQRGDKRDGAEMQESSAPAEQDGGSSSSTDDDVGPSLPCAAPKRKKRKLPYESLHIAALPGSARYSKSLMHKDQLLAVTLTPLTDFLITTSVEGTVKFWKVTAGGVEFVKEFAAHRGSEVVSVSVSCDGRSFASAASDSIAIFDVLTFDLLAMIRLQDSASSICWIHKRGASIPLLAVALQTKADILVFDGRCTTTDPIHIIKKLHRFPVSCMAFNNEYDCVISADDNGMLEYWSPSSGYEKPSSVFTMKSSTSLFEIKKAKSVPTSITISPTGQQFATYSFPDRRIRVFDFQSAKLHRTYDESIATLAQMQQAGTALHVLDQPDFDRRLTAEIELDNAAARRRINVQFDQSGHFLLYGSLLGIKVINILTNRVVKLYGRSEPFRPLNLALYQGAPQRKGVVTVAMAASDNPLLHEAEMRNAILVSTGAGKLRFYMFTNDTEISKSSRDVQNEKPQSLLLASNTTSNPSSIKQQGTQAILHTSHGDITLSLLPAIAPKTVQNFITHARNGYYNDVIFHRIIRKFMVQTGDPLGDGTGGTSIWGREFEDEISEQVRHAKYTLSMANAGPNTNGSQFFITTVEAPWLDGKHTIFGKAVAGYDVIHRIENAKCYKEKPEVDIKIVSVSMT